MVAAPLGKLSAIVRPDATSGLLKEHFESRRLYGACPTCGGRRRRRRRKWGQFYAHYPCPDCCEEGSGGSGGGSGGSIIPTSGSDGSSFDPPVGGCQYCIGDAHYRYLLTIAGWIDGTFWGYPAGGCSNKDNYNGTYVLTYNPAYKPGPGYCVWHGPCLPGCCSNTVIHTCSAANGFRYGMALIKSGLIFTISVSIYICDPPDPCDGGFSPTQGSWSKTTSTSGVKQECWSPFNHNLPQTVNNRGCITNETPAGTKLTTCNVQAA